MIYLSLYEYLGKAAGSDLGKEVAAAAYKANITTQTKEITNPAFAGKINLYPKDFLEFYFREPELNLMDELPGTLNKVIDEDDLPF